MASESDRANAFTEIYQRGTWASPQSASGTGSNPQVARPYVDFVLGLLRRLQIRSVLDVGHGDWAMWPEKSFHGVKYLGIDVVPGLSERVGRIHGGLS
jgi:hypothetical protein